MAHGSPRIVICHDCKQYAQINRFSIDPNCPNCGKKSEQTDEEKIRKRYNLGIFSYNFILSFDHWTKIK